MRAEKPLDPGLYLVADIDCLAERSLEDTVAAAVRGGVTVVQLRMKSASTREFIRRARLLKSILAGPEVPLVINDRVDVALAAGADGVHLGHTDMPYEDAVRILGNAALIGISIENAGQAREAASMDLSYVAASPVFSTPTKTDTAPALGLSGLRELRPLTQHKIVAIGGINESNALQVLEAGADGIAVVSAICRAPNPEEAARRLRHIVDSFRSRQKETQK